MRAMKSLRIVLIALMFTCACASARAQVLLEEGKIKLNVTPGENIAGKLMLHNTSDQNVNMKVYWEDFVYTPPFDGSKKFLPKGTTDHSIAGWVNVPMRTLIFAPYAKKTVSYSINVPDDIRMGHHGVLFFEKESFEVESTKGLNVVTRVGCLFFIEPVNKSKRVNMTNFRFTGKELTADFSNQGDVVLIPDGIFYIIDQEGMVYDRGEINKIYLPPGETGEYKMAFNQGLNSGFYTLVMTVDLDDDDVLVKEIDFRKSGSFDFNIVEIRD